MSNAVFSQNENETDSEFEVRAHMIGCLVQQWDEIDRTQDRMIYSIENGEWDGEFLDEEDQERFQKETERRFESLATRKRLIEVQLSALEARLARPYEHWNEQEREMEYLENRGW